MIPFNRPAHVGDELTYIKQVIEKGKFSGDGDFASKCHMQLESSLGALKALITPSCTAALETAALLSDIKLGDEVIMPSYTFPSSATAFVLRGAKIVFIDIRPDTMNLDENLIEPAITEKTRAICVVHYAGVSCEMNAIIKIAKKHGLFLIEDAAQGILAKYRDNFLGTLGDFGALSFHETKNIQCGEGGAILINDKRFVEKAEIIREKGTDRSKFWRGEIDKYGWVDIGSSYLLSELSAAYLCAQLAHMKEITSDRLASWELYHNLLAPLAVKGSIELPHVPESCTHNAHIFFIKAKDNEERSKLIAFLRSRGIMSVFHYLPLHSSTAGKKFGRFFGNDRFTTRESERLLRLPLFYRLEQEHIEKICHAISDFYRK